MKWRLNGSVNWSLLTGVLLLTAFLGCRDNSAGTIPVRGKITYGGGDWPTSGVIYFAPLTKTSHGMRPGLAKFDQSGNFVAQTYSEGDGLLPGEYAIKVECWDKPPSLEPGAPPAKSYVPKDIQLGTAPDWRVTVSPDQKSVNIELDVPK